MEALIHQLKEIIVWFAISAVLFSALAYLNPSLRGQRFLRKGIILDTFYWFLTPIMSSTLSPFVILAISSTLLLLSGEKQFSIFVESPIALQVLVVLLLSDMLQYVSHRLFHGTYLWKYHAIHHSPTEIDWLTSSRFHPVNILIHSTLIAGLVSALGFDPVVFALLVPFNTLYSGMVHANLNWTFGPLAKVFASPIFHRWHHTFPDEGGNKNFAPTFSFLDVLFGTYYMPKNKVPTRFGIDAPIEEDLIEQLLSPWKQGTTKAVKG